MTEQRIQSPIVGVKFVPGAQAIIDDTPDDATVKLVRHPENVFDSNAVGVHICGARVGYVEPYQIRTISQDRLTKRIAAAEETVRREVAHRIELFTRCRP